MKYVAALAAFTFAALLAWPYLYVYRLDNALASGEVEALRPLVELEAVREQVKTAIEKDVNDAVGDGGGRMMRWLKQGVKAVSDTAVEINVDMQWVFDTLNNKPGDPPTPRASLMSDVDYAFYESWDRFIIRLGALDADPTHIRLALRDGSWKVVAVLGP